MFEQLQSFVKCMRNSFQWNQGHWLKFCHMGHTIGKCLFGCMQTAKAQIRLCIRTVWSGPSLSAARIIWYYTMFQWRTNAWNRLRMRWMNLNLGILLMLKDTFSLCAALMLGKWYLGELQSITYTWVKCICPEQTKHILITGHSHSLI